MKTFISAGVIGCMVLVASFALQAQQRGQRGTQPPAQPGQPAAAASSAPAPKPLVPVAASTLAAHPEAYYGERVTMTGAIEQSLGKLVFSVDQDKTKTSEQQVLVLAPRLNTPIDPNTYITVIGEAVAFDPAELAKRAKDYPVELSPEIIAKFKGRPAIFATNVITTAGTDLALRLPPPMTADEKALQEVMKQVGAANGALRGDADKMDVASTKEHAATLTKAFTTTEAFWKTKGKADAMQWAQEAKTLAMNIDAAAAAAKWDDVKTSAGTLGQKCASCHGAYRERFDDGSFRIKNPSR